MVRPANPAARSGAKKLAVAPAHACADPKDIAGAFVATNPELVWADTSQRGYMTIDITPRRVTGEWLFLRTIKSRDTTVSGTHRLSAERGRRTGGGIAE